MSEPPVIPDLVLVSGMSGAGRSTAAKCLEDLGWFVVDNLPPELLPVMVELGGRSQGAVPRIAAVVDVRSRRFFDRLRESLDELVARGVTTRMLFLEASDETLVRRFESVRRPHPLQGDGRVVDGIAEERRLLGDLRGEAEFVIDTSGLNVHQLRSRIDDAFRSDVRPSLQTNLASFGYKYGVPVDADVVLDCRFLPNPHWVPELRPQTGLDPEVSAFVLGRPGATEFVKQVAELLTLVADGYLREGRRFATVAIGCTGGRHRSVAIVEELARHLDGAPVELRVTHRDLGRE